MVSPGQACFVGSVENQKVVWRDLLNSKTILDTTKMLQGTTVSLPSFTCTCAMKLILVQVIQRDMPWVLQQELMNFFIKKEKWIYLLTMS